jgi:integrase
MFSRRAKQLELSENIPTKRGLNPRSPLSLGVRHGGLPAALKRAGLQIRFHGLRHTCITKLAESQASEHTLMAIAGHVSRKMIEHYSHIRMEAKRAALDAIVNAQSSQAVLWGRCEPKREPNPGGRFEGFH